MKIKNVLDLTLNLVGCYLSTPKGIHIITNVNPPGARDSTVLGVEGGVYTFNYVKNCCEVITKEENPEYFL